MDKLGGIVDFLVKLFGSQFFLYKHLFLDKLLKHLPFFSFFVAGETWFTPQSIAMAERVLTRVHSLRERLDATLAAHRNEILLFLSR